MSPVSADAGRPPRQGALRAPLSPTQRDIHLDQQLRPELPVHRVGSSVCLGRDLDPGLWQDAVREVFAADPILRTRVEESDGEVFQCVDEGASIHLEFEEDFAGDAEAIHDHFARRVRAAPPERATLQHWLLRTAEGEFHAGLGEPHIFTDGHSHQTLFQRAARCYEALAAGRPPPDLTSPTFYDYLREAAPAVDDPETVELWRERLDGVAPLRFRTRPGDPGEFLADRLTLDAAESEALAAYCRARRVRPDMLFLGLYAVLVQRYREPAGDWVAHAIRETRPPGFRDTTGCFFGVLPHRMPEELLARGARLEDLFGHLRSHRRGLGRRRDISVLALAGMLPAGGCRAVYNFYNFDEVRLLGQARTLETYFTHPPDELHLIVASRDGRVELRHLAHSSRLDDRTVLERLRRLVAQVAAGAERVGDLDWLLEGERPARLVGARPAGPAPRPVHERFEEHAAGRPDAVAVVEGEDSRTYAELNAHANRLARLLVAEGVGPGVAVGLHLGRSFEQVAAVLAVLKAGGAYVPIDPGYPEARARFILGDSQVALVVTDGTLCAAATEGAARTLRLGEAADEILAQDAADPGPRAGPGDLAYVIYTSGSTGRPKGVMVSHRNVARLFSATREPFGFGAADVWPLLHSYAFDFSVWEMWGALAFGGRLVVVPEAVARSPEDLCALLEREGATVLNQTPSAFYRLMEAERLAGGRPLESLRWIVFGGEALDIGRLAPWFERHGEERPALVNMYGITETTVHATWRRLLRADSEPGRPSVIGRPLPDLRVHLADEEGQPVPRGVAGELCVAGEGVSLGYLGREDLTAERFAEDPAAPDGGRLYRSGDLARELPGGELEYLGRLDGQVQVRGYRVELGEVEAALRRHPAVADAAVLARADTQGEPSLTAYVACEAEAGPAEPELRELLSRELPSYMACARYVLLPELPLTAHGKVDRDALPEPGHERPELAEPFAPPRDPAEEVLAEAFAAVTGLERVGIHDDFFALGGNSLLATQALGRIRESLGAALPLSAIFEAPTVAGLAKSIEAGRFDEDGGAPPRPARVEDGADPPPTAAQERVWLIQQLAPSAVAYNFEASFRFRGELRVDLLERCLGDLVERHEVLRTTFPAVGGRPVQRIHPRGPVALETVALDGLPLAEAEREMERRRREDASEPFAPDRLPLVRWTLFRLAAGDHVLVHREHHLLHDGWSFIVLAGELLRLYRARLGGRPPGLPPLPLRLGDFAHAERAWLAGAGAQRQLEHWGRRLANAPAPLELPTDFPRPAHPSYRGDALRFDLPADVVRSLRALAREEGVTLFAAMLGVFAVLLARYSGEDDLCIGSGVANRRRPELEGIVGMMLNNVVLRLRPGREATLSEVLTHAQEVVLDGLANQELPFDRMIRLMSPGTAAGGGPPGCPVFFSSWDGALPQVPIPGLAVEVEAGLPNGSAKFDLNVIVVARAGDAFSPAAGQAPASERVTVIWEYATELFEPASMKQMADDYVGLLRGAASGAARPWLELGLESERRALALARPPAAAYPREASIPGLFAEQVERAPGAVAVRDAGGAWSYGELDRRANRLAHLLRARGVQAGELVGLCLPRGREAVACMLAILRAGAAYLPLDPRQPQRRVAWLAADSGIRFALAGSGSRALLGACPGLEALLLEEIEAELGGLPAHEPPGAGTGDSLAYVMYTSGSTGPPKGVEIVHRGVVRLLFGTDYVRLGPGRRILQLAPLSFDASTFEIWAALLHGGTLVVYPDDVPDTAGLGRVIAAEGIDTMWLNASHFNLIVDTQAEVLAPLEQLLVGGEALSIEHVRRAQRLLPRTQIVNGYGPTENTTFSCCFPIPRDLPEGTASVPLGRPIAHSSAYVLDGRMRPLPPGAIGEIHLGGDGLARGYRGRPELTAERFVPDPWSPDPGARLYRSGDFGRLRTDGTLEFRGRRDQQVKIRGFRIEPAEVEWALERLPGVRGAAVVARADGPGTTPRLVAYVVPEEGTQADAGRLRSQARRELPAHLVPADLVLIDELPLSARGKLDRAALPPPPAARPLATSREAPRSAREEIVAGVMAEVLGVEEVGRADGFFDLGGHSLLGLELVERLSRTFGVDVPVRGLLEDPTAAGLAALVELEEDGQDGTPRSSNGAARSLVPIKPGGARRPLFFTPGGDGGEGALLVYAGVARFLGPDQPFYGLKARGVEGGGDPHRSVEEMAAAYLAEVRAVQPEGPYLFGGECVGGVIAYEMARQVVASGERMGLLVLLDSRPPRLASHARHWVRFLSSRARRVADELLGPPGEAPPGADGAARAKAILRRRLEDLLPFDHREAPPTIEREWVEYQRTLLRYRARPYGGRLALLLSEQYAARNTGPEWERLARGGVERRVVPGDHDSYIRRHARDTARILEACIDEAQTRA